jgi:hypothetical protein
LQKLLRNLLWGFLFLQVLLFSSRRKSSFGHMAITIMGVSVQWLQVRYLSKWFCKADWITWSRSHTIAPTKLTIIVSKVSRQMNESIAQPNHRSPVPEVNSLDKVS